MSQVFRRIKHQLVHEGQLRKYLGYALGEILLVVIGILIAIQVNNWNENRKGRQYEQYILQEIVNNLAGDGEQIKRMLKQREKTQFSITRMEKYLFANQYDQDTFAYDLGQLFTFERYFPIRTSYEVAKANGLQISNQELRTQIANYYEYEQNIVQSSIKDIENSFLQDLRPIPQQHFSINYGNSVIFNGAPNINLIDDVKSILKLFVPNHTGTILQIK